MARHYSREDVERCYHDSGRHCEHTAPHVNVLVDLAADLRREAAGRERVERLALLSAAAKAEKLEQALLACGYEPRAAAPALTVVPTVKRKRATSEDAARKGLVKRAGDALKGCRTHFDGADHAYRAWRRDNGLGEFKPRPECFGQWTYGNTRAGGVKASPEAAHYLAMEAIEIERAAA